MSKVYKTLAFLLSFIMIFTALPVAQLSAFAAEPTKLTEPWAPSVLVAEDWTGNTDKITDGVFDVAATQNTYTIWTAENYDFSDGVVFKGTLAMKNSYLNFYGEWCSVYLGTATSNLELRIKNDDDTADNQKDNTYTAYLLYNGAELASCDMYTSINGQYQLTYANGKVNVKLGGADIIWTLTNQTTSTKVDVNANLSNAKLGLRLSGNWAPEGGRRWSAISLSPSQKSVVLSGTGVEFGPHNIPVPADWTPDSNTIPRYYHDSGNPTGNIVLKGGNNTNDASVTYKNIFDATNGFALNYCVSSTAMSNNYTNDKIYHAVKIGNITAGIVVSSYNENYVYGTDNCLRLVIKIDGETVAESDSIYDERYGGMWNNEKENVENIALFLREYVVVLKKVYRLVYNPQTDTLSFTYGNVTAAVSNVGNRLELDEATLTLISNSSWNIEARYYYLSLVGDLELPIPAAPETPILPDESGTPSTPDTPVVPDTPIPDNPVDPDEPITYGEKITQLWQPEEFTTTDWQGDTDKIEGNRFYIGHTSGSANIWTTKNYDLSEGFVVGAYLEMSNTYKNYLGEWCSIYIGTKDKNLELRLRNDDMTPDDSNKDKTYTAYLYLNGSCIASHDLNSWVNRDYTIAYKDGKIQVEGFFWTLADGSTAKEIEIDSSYFANAKIGLSLQGNWSDNKSRNWRYVHISPISSGDKCGENATWTFDSTTGTLYINGTGEMYDLHDYWDNFSPWYSFNRDVKKIVIGDGITHIGKYNFYEYTCLVSVEMADSVTTVGDSAFERCTSLKNVDLSDGLSAISQFAFRSCNSLEYIKLPDAVNCIDSYAFMNCASLKKVDIGGGLMTINSLAFNECSSLEEISLPSSIYEIGYNAFLGCTSLKNVYYRATEVEKERINILYGNSALTNATWHYNSCIGAAEHTYNNAVDTDCNICGDIREVNYTGWLLEGNTWYYYQNNVAVTGWQQIGYTWYYFNDNGAMQTGWLLLGDTWYFFGDSGNMLTGWQYIGYNWYYFNSYGAMLTGWQQIGYAWYYFGDSGNMLTGWQYIGNTWYYFSDSGNMLTGWQYIGSTWYYFADGGNMLTDWQQIGYTWYYFNEGGAMLTGWQYIGGTWYYFGTSGNMLTGWQQIGYTWYYFNEGGAMLTGWHLLGGNWYYFNEGGAWIA